MTGIKDHGIMTENATTITIRDENVSEILLNEIPYRLGKYEIKNELGRGTCGVVYKGYDPFVRRPVAIKVGWCDPVAANQATTQSHMDVFSEAHAVGKLQHPNIVALYDAQTEKELCYLIMEYVEGETLLEYCRPNGKRLPPAKVVECVFKCCLALDFSHQIGVIHRDIKPSNIMLSRDGETKIMDFSVALVTHNKTVNPEFIVGSPNYMSPEQVRRKPIGPQSDLYSLAAVMYQLLTGNTLFLSGNVKRVFHDVVHTPPPKLSESRPDLPDQLSLIIDKALSKDPAHRYQSGKQMAADLTAVYDNLIYLKNNISSGAKITNLRELPFFSEFSACHMQEIMTISTMLRFKSGHIICKEGDIDNSFYLIVRGQAQVLKLNKKLATLHQGDCFGEVGSLMENKRSTTLLANSDVVVLKVNAMRIETLSMATQLLYYKAFTTNLIGRLSGPIHTGI
jgi:serine/threonine-protein kinase